MKKALILNNVVVQVEDTEFQVSAGLAWIDCPDDCEVGWIVENGSVVEKTPSSEEILEHISIYRDLKAENFIYKTITMKLTDGARADITAVYFSVVLNTSIPDATVMMNWQEEGQTSLPITAGDLRADGTSFMTHRQKCFTAAGIVKATHETTPYASFSAVETAFEDAYSAT